jgi:uncharacterized UBP type Zn finger protein
VPDPCTHLQDARRRTGAKPSGPGCQECLETGDGWVHLRLCLTCGHVGCCDSSPNRHATHHFHRTGHPVIRSFEPGEAWSYCYLDDQLVERFPARPGEAAPRHYQPP